MPPLAEQIESAIRNPQSAILNLAGQTSLRELMALLKLCRVLLTNDTGPMHVAAALGTPVVVPFGSTSPELTGPGLPGDPRHRLLKSDAPCSPCFLRECPIDFRCMNGISVERVVEAVLSRNAGRARHSVRAVLVDGERRARSDAPCLSTGSTPQKKFLLTPAANCHSVL